MAIAKFFKEIGWVDELGSGVRNIYKYNRIYSGADPEFIEGDVFKTIIPLPPQVNPQAEVDAEDQRTESILKFCREPKSRKEIQEFLGIKDRRYFANSILKPLIKGDLLKLTMPEKPTSPKQKYYSNR